MSPQNLWAVLWESEDSLVESGVSGLVSQGWALASEGSAGLAEIAPSAAPGFLMAMSLKDLRTAWGVMEQVKGGFFPASADRWLPFVPKVYVVLIETPNKEKI